MDVPQLDSRIILFKHEANLRAAPLKPIVRKEIQVSHQISGILVPDGEMIITT